MSSEYYRCNPIYALIDIKSLVFELFARPNFFSSNCDLKSRDRKNLVRFSRSIEFILYEFYITLSLSPFFFPLLLFVWYFCFFFFFSLFLSTLIHSAEALKMNCNSKSVRSIDRPHRTYYRSTTIIFK